MIPLAQSPHFDSYCTSLEQGTASKLQMILPWVNDEIVGDIVDIGSGTGCVTVGLAEGFRTRRIIGIDQCERMIARARRRDGACARVDFRVGDGKQVHTQSASTVVLSSVLHEIYSEQGGWNAVRLALNAAWRSLRSGGRIIVRDFVRPRHALRRVVMRHYTADMKEGHDFQTLSNDGRRYIRFEGVNPVAGWTDYLTDLAGAYEFMFRKDYGELWESELAEEYGFWSRPAAESILQALGFELIHCEESHDPWVTSRRLHGRIALLDPESGARLANPYYRILLVGEKPGPPR